MAKERLQRRLAAILSADVVGYSRLMGSDEAGTLARLKAMRRDLIDPVIAAHSGRIVKLMGDGALVEFASAVDAVTCAIEIQRQLREHDADGSEANPIRFRIGINVGDIIIEGDDILGDGVNIAARIEGIAEPGGISISEDAWRQVQGKVAANFVDTGEQGLKNIARPVRVYRVDLVPTAASVSEASRSTLVPPDKPSIAVLAFNNMSGDPEQEYFADGIAEDIITMLSHSRSLFVIARTSSFTYKGRAVDVKQIARELGVRYVLEGGVRRGGNRVRVTAQLIDAETGNHLWGERYDRDPVDIFAVQDEITEAVTIAIEPAVADMERRRAVRKPPESLGAWEAYQRGLWHMGCVSATDNEAAKHLFQRAIILDPNFAPAYARFAFTIFDGAGLYGKSSIHEALSEGLPFAKRAISLDPLEPVAQFTMGWAFWAQGDYEGALAEGRRALAISPNYAAAYHLVGAALIFSGEPASGLEAIRKSMRLDPHDPQMFIRLAQIIAARYFLRDYAVAADAAKTFLRSYPDNPWGYRWLEHIPLTFTHSPHVRRNWRIPGQ